MEIILTIKSRPEGWADIVCELPEGSSLESQTMIHDIARHGMKAMEDRLRELRLAAGLSASIPISTPTRPGRRAQICSHQS